MKIFLVSFLSLFFSLKYYSQDFLGYSASEYAGVTAIDIQPANLADNRFRFDMVLTGLSVKAYNNYVGIKRFGLKGWAKGEPAMGAAGLTDDQIKGNYLELNDGGKNKTAYVSSRIVLPSFLIEINHKNTIALTWDVRNFVNVDGITPDLAKLIYSDFKVPSLWPKQLNAKNVSMQAMSWAEYGVTYARVLKEDNQHAFKIAGRVKVMEGLGSAYLFAKELNYQFPTDTTMNILSTDVEYGHSSNLQGTTSLNYKWVSNPGFGLDFGFVYEYRPDYKSYTYNMDNEKNLWRRDKSKYKFKAGFSILDLGGIRFKKGQFSGNFNANVNALMFKKKFNINGPGVTAFGSQSSLNFNALDDSLLSLGVVDKSAGTYFMNLPTAISTQADYKLWKDFDINFIAYFAFQFKNDAHKVHDFTSFSLTPAWDHKWFGVFVPLQYHKLYGFAYGACIRIGPLVIGTDNLSSIIGNKTFSGTDIYGMLKIPVPFGRPRDKDKDEVSDKKDLCKETPGTWEFMGCADTDGDHIKDTDDKCPLVAGSIEMRGCPDKDGDKITDLEDDCPEIAGTIEFKGCPDRDGDKIIDKNDSCPDISGLKEFNGCPDLDGDGITDKEDVCPDVAGPKEYKGCPDKDGDGVLDKEDACVDVVGALENKGCPWPDSDNDGVLDKEDKCPTVAGVKENAGCPIVSKVEEKIIEQAFEHLEFATGKEIIKSSSFPTLDALAKIMQSHEKDWSLRLSGHTDNQGTPEKNLLLSQKRAESVMKYLVKKGEKSDKIIVEFFGSTKPIADNSTELGRQQNRRVEMKIIFTK